MSRKLDVLLSVLVLSFIVLGCMMWRHTPPVEEASIAAQQQQPTAPRLQQPPPHVCSIQQRLDRLKHWCQLQETVNGAHFPDVESLTKKELQKTVRYLLMDPQHQVLYCDIAKAGSSTWKHLLANNTGRYNSSRPPRVHAMRVLRDAFNITQLKTYPRAAILQALRTHFTFVVVRHPLDRLVSAYREKLAGGNGYYERILGSRILREIRYKGGGGANANASERNVISKGRGVTFREYATFVSTVHMKDQHFENYNDHCHPCVIRYDYVAKLESQDLDKRYIVNEHLSGYGTDGSVSKNARRGGARVSKPLVQFANISRRLQHDLAAVYARDLDMFGYSFTRQDEHIVATCGDSSATQCC